MDIAVQSITPGKCRFLSENGVRRRNIGGKRKHLIKQFDRTLGSLANQERKPGRNIVVTTREQHQDCHQDKVQI